jgi:hypothetical protein
MTSADFLTRLAEIRADVHSIYESDDGLHRARLEQFDGALATAGMAVTHLSDEETRHRHDAKAHQKAIGAYVREDY